MNGFSLLSNRSGNDWVRLTWTQTLYSDKSLSCCRGQWNDIPDNSTPLVVICCSLFSLIDCEVLWMKMICDLGYTCVLWCIFHDQPLQPLFYYYCSIREAQEVKHYHMDMRETSTYAVMIFGSAMIISQLQKNLKRMEFR